MFHPSQKEFEKFVPSLRDGGEEIYKGVYPYLQPSYWRLKNELKVELMNNKCAPYFRRAVYATAAYNALPTLDLVATPNGFGVVSNNNIAPASKERVAALRESLRQYKSDCKDQCLERYYQELKEHNSFATNDLLNHSLDNKSSYPGESIAHLIFRSGVLFSATVARENGITMPDGQPVYEEEMRRLEYKLAAADVKIKKLISGKQFDYEMGADRFGDKLDLMLRRLAAMYVMQADRRAIKDYENEILDFMEEDAVITETNKEGCTFVVGDEKYKAAERFKYYHASVQRQLRKNPVRYENRKEDATYFF